tara:strand:+ start:1087 stop:1347 length:261 start_codon:yes stop_codon:yes gene_type:complete
MSKEIDGYLKSLIKDVPDKLDRFYTSNEKSMVYYVGNFAEDVLNNFTEKQSEKLFKKIRTYHDNYIFVQRKLKNDLDGYEYIVAKK